MVHILHTQSFKKYVILFFSIAFMAQIAAAQSDNFSRGEELFRQNEPESAIPYLKKAVSEGSAQAYVYLSIAYLQTGNYTEGLNICNVGMKASNTNKKILAYNAGNLAFASGDYGAAESWFSKAIVADPLYAEPVLNRANAKLKQNKYKDSRLDYIHYLELATDDPQEEQIRILIKLLDDQIAADEQAEQDRIAEEKRLKEEADRIAKEEEARRKKLLDDVANSLKDTDTENVSAGAEDTVDYGYESELE